MILNEVRICLQTWFYSVENGPLLMTADQLLFASLRFSHLFTYVM